MPLTTALIGGRFATDEAYLRDATARRVNQLARAKAAFEGTPLPPPAVPSLSPAAAPARSSPSTIQAVMFTVIAVLAIAAGVGTLVWQAVITEQQNAYDGATSCASASDALTTNRCVYAVAATVTWIS